jgi:hypothetical protein
MSVATEEEIASRPIAVIGSGTGRGSCCNAMSMAARWVSNQTAVSTTTTPVNNKTDGDRYPAPLIPPSETLFRMGDHGTVLPLRFEGHVLRLVGVLSTGGTQ